MFLGEKVRRPKDIEESWVRTLLCAFYEYGLKKSCDFWEVTYGYDRFLIKWRIFFWGFVTPTKIKKNGCTTVCAVSELV